MNISLGVLHEIFLKTKVKRNLHYIVVWYYINVNIDLFYVFFNNCDQSSILILKKF